VYIYSVYIVVVDNLLSLDNCVFNIEFNQQSSRHVRKSSYT